MNKAIYIIIAALMVAVMPIVTAATDISVVSTAWTSAAINQYTNAEATTTLMYNGTVEMVKFEIKDPAGVITNNSYTSNSSATTYVYTFNATQAGIYNLTRVWANLTTAEKETAYSGKAVNAAFMRVPTIPGCSSSDVALFALVSICWVAGLVFFVWRSITEADMFAMVATGVLILIAATLATNMMTILKAAC